jgi:hypothetical protein
MAGQTYGVIVLVEGGPYRLRLLEAVAAEELVVTLAGVGLPGMRVMAGGALHLVVIQRKKRPWSNSGCAIGDDRGAARGDGG